MAILPIFEREETVRIMKEIIKDPRSTPELNEILCAIRRPICTTSTLYRRVNDLIMANIIVKNSNLKLEITDYGRELFREFEMANLTEAEERVLDVLRKGPFHSTSELLHHLRMSPNTIVRTLKSLDRKKMIVMQAEKEVEKQGKRGRSRKQYSISKKGSEKLDNRKKLKEKASRRK